MRAEAFAEFSIIGEIGAHALREAEREGRAGVEAVEHLVAEHVLATGLLELAAELVDDMLGDLGRRRCLRWGRR